MGKVFVMGSFYPLNWKLVVFYFTFESESLDLHGTRKSWLHLLWHTILSLVTSFLDFTFVHGENYVLVLINFKGGIPICFL